MKNDVVNIKGTRHGLVIILDTTKSFSELKENLIEKISQKKGFFQGAKFTFDKQSGTLNEEQASELETLCMEFGLIPSAEVVPLSLQNLSKQYASGPQRGAVKSSVKPATPQGDSINTKGSQGLKGKSSSDNKSKGDIVPLQGVTEKELSEQTLLVQQGLRSGHKIHFDGNVVILGDVNPGAEVITSGSIVVMGILRGIAHAGAAGDDKATISAYSLRPMQIRIGNIIGRSPDNDPKKGTLWPEKASISNGQIIIDYCYTGKMKKTI